MQASEGLQSATDGPGLGRLVMAVGTRTCSSCTQCLPPVLKQLSWPRFSRALAPHSSHSGESGWGPDPCPGGGPHSAEEGDHHRLCRDSWASGDVSSGPTVPVRMHPGDLPGQG